MNKIERNRMCVFAFFMYFCLYLKKLKCLSLRFHFYTIALLQYQITTRNLRQTKRIFIQKHTKSCPILRSITWTI